MYLLLYCKGSKSLFKVCVWEGVGDRTETAIFWPPLLWPSTLCLSRSPGLLNRRPRGPRCWVMAFFNASYQQLPCTPTHQSPKALSAWCGFPYHISSITPTPTLTATVLTSVLTELYNSSRLLSRQLDLWNRMFDRHQAEVTVMQFTGYSLPVHQSMSVSWEFFLPRPISSANFRPRDFLS